MTTTFPVLTLVHHSCLLFSIGGVIGTGEFYALDCVFLPFHSLFFIQLEGLFLGTATSLGNGGPIGTFKVLFHFNIKLI